jgi:hypothetical protein
MLMRAKRPLGLLTAAAAVAVMSGGCGDSGDDGATAAGDGKSGDDAAVAAAFRTVESAFEDGDAKRYCSALTPAAQKQAVRFSVVGSRKGGCLGYAKEAFRLNKKAGVKQRRAKIVSVQVAGDEAVAVVRDPGSKPLKTWFAKQGGEWKMDATRVQSSPTTKPLPPN